MLQPGHLVTFDREHFLRREGTRPFFVQRPKGAVLLVAAGAAGDLRHLGDGQAALAATVKLVERGEGDMVHVHVEPHADRVGGNEVVDLAGLKHRHLGIARARGQRAHHHRGAAAQAPQRLGHRIDFLGREGDDRRAARQPGKLLGAGIAERREARAADNLRLGHQCLEHRPQAVRSQDHRLLAAACAQQPIGEDMATLRIGAQLRLVQRHERRLALQRHAFGRAAEPACLGRQDLLLTGDQRDFGRAFHGHHAVIHLAREQPQREADHAAGMAAHPLDGEVGLAGVGGPQHCRDGRTGELAHVTFQDRRPRRIRQLLAAAFPRLRDGCARPGHFAARAARVGVCGVTGRQT